MKSSGERNFLLQTEESLWDPSNMYLLLPLESEDIAADGPLKINWTGIGSCVSAVEFLKRNAWLNFQQTEVIDDNLSLHVSDPIVTEVSSQIIHLANISASVDRLKEMVVVAIHTGRIYSILDIVPSTSAESPFEGDADASYSSFAEYYHKKCVFEDLLFSFLAYFPIINFWYCQILHCPEASRTAFDASEAKP